MKAHQACYRVTTMSRVLEVSRGGYYAWLKRGPSERAKANETLLARIASIHQESDGTYGAPRVRAELKAEGNRASLGRVARVMKGAGLEGVSRRRKKRTTVRAGGARTAPDLVDRNFRATGPNQLWVADITYIPTWSGFLYLAIVLDAWSRAVVGWAMETHLRTELVLKALDMAAWRRRPLEVIHHSDHGSQYTSLAFGKRCDELSVRPSLGSVGDAYDNAMAESFFATLECELIDRYSFRTPAEARPAVFRYIEGWYNTRRRHSGLGYESPLDFERKHGLAGVSAAHGRLWPAEAEESSSRKATRHDAPGTTIVTSADRTASPVPEHMTAISSSALSLPGTATLYSPAP